MPLTLKNFNKAPKPVITTAGIYHNPGLGLISISTNGTTWITIADKNVGATTVYNYGDTMTADNCGNLFQFGNNYPFNWKASGEITSNISTGQTDASAYGPGNYYSSSLYFNSDQMYWDSSKNKNIWGFQTAGNDAKRGPCEYGFHVPTYSEVNTLVNAGVTLGAWVTGNGGAQSISTRLMLPISGYGSNTGYISSVGSQGFITTCGGFVGDNMQVQIFTIVPGQSSQIYYATRWTIFSTNIRPFANTPVQPDTGWTRIF